MMRSGDDEVIGEPSYLNVTKKLHWKMCFVTFSSHSGTKRHVQKTNVKRLG